MSYSNKRIGLLLVTLLAAAWHPAAARVTVTVDAQTLNDVLTAMSTQELQVPLTDTRSILVKVDDLAITALEPPVEGEGNGTIVTTVRLRVPEFGLNMRVEPRLTMNVVEQETGSLLEVRFEEVALPIPYTGSINLAPFLPPTLLPADQVWSLQGGMGGETSIRSHIAKIEMGRESIRFVIDVTVLP